MKKYFFLFYLNLNILENKPKKKKCLYILCSWAQNISLHIPWLEFFFQPLILDMGFFVLVCCYLVSL